MAALAKDPARRWQSAADFAAGLIAAGEQIEAGAATGQDTAAFAPIPIPLGVEDATAATRDEPPPVLAPVTAPEEERKRRWPWFTIGLLVLALAGFLIFLAVSELTKAETREVPRVTGTQLVEAREILERAGFEVEETRVQSRLAFDQVLDQDPDPGEEAEEGSTVLLEVSGGPGTVRVPSVANLPVKQVVNRLEDRGLRADLDKRSSDSVDEGLAIRSVPGAGEVVERGETVKVFISSGPERVEVPDVIGLSRESAEARISDAGLEPGAVTEQESEETEGEVLAQDPAGGAEVERGATVNLTVSTGVETVDVPDVVGLGAGDASGQIRADGLVPVQRETEVTDPAEDGNGDRSAPGRGHRRREGSRGCDHRRRARRGGRDHPRRSGGGTVRVAVLAGGRSSEHDVSLASAQSVRAGLAEGGHEPVDVRIDRDGRWTHDGRGSHAGALRAACSTPTRSFRPCTGPSARTAPSRACSTCSTSRTWVRACWRRRYRWTRRSSRI